VPVLALLAQVNVPSPGEPSDALARWITIFFVLMGLGFVFGIVGHLTKSRVLVGVGVALVMLSSAVFVVAVVRQG
jgi:hypothetical protein